MRTFNGIRCAARQGTLLGLTVVAAISTLAKAEPECGTVVLPEDIETVLYLESIGAYELAVGPRYVLNVPMTVHIVAQGNGSGGIDQATVSATISSANDHWRDAGMQFFQSGSARFIDNDNFYFNIDTLAEINQLKQTDAVPNTLNVYFTPNLAVEDGPDPDTMPDALCGQSSFTWSGVQGLVMANDCTALSLNTSTFAHEVGHYFDLLHTHETASGAECPDGSNCGNSGDWVCDTPADPNLTGNLNGCTYNGTAMRCGQAFNPDPTNLMSYGGGCRTHFVFGQHNRALATLVNQRANLIGGPLAVTWVDFGYGGTENGSFYQPFNDLPSAAGATGPGGRIVMKAGATPQTITINQSVTLDSFRGIATIGQ